MNAQEIIKPNGHVFKTSDPINLVIKLFSDKQIRGVVVVNDSNIAVGVISREDFFTHDNSLHIPTYIKLLQDSKFKESSVERLPYAVNQLLNLTCADIMNQHVYFAHSSTPLETIAASLTTANQEIVPVVTEENQFVGVISNLDLFNYLASGTPAPQLSEVVITRPVDNEIGVVRSDIGSKFSYIASSRARLWLSITMVLFVIGFGLGIIFIVDPGPIMDSINENIQTILKKL